MVTELVTPTVSSLHHLYTIIVPHKKQATSKPCSLAFLTACQPSFCREGDEESPSLQDPADRVLSFMCQLLKQAAPVIPEPSVGCWSHIATTLVVQRKEIISGTKCPFPRTPITEVAP